MIQWKDDDLRSPKHDAIMAWTHQHVEEVLASVCPECQVDASPKIRWEVPIKASSGQVIGFADMLVDCAGWIFLLEIKSTITNVGELLRQINYYRTVTHVGERIPVVVSPDDRYAAILASQEIRFYKCPQP